MCLTIVHHQSELEIRSLAIINPYTGRKFFNPYQTILEEGYHGAAIGENYCTLHGASCTKNEWQICNAEDDKSACLGWQTFHMVTSSKDERFLSQMGKPLLPSDERQVSSDRHAPYIELRMDFWEAGTQVEWWSHELEVCSKKLAVQRAASCNYGYLFTCLKEARKQLQGYIDELQTLTRRWNLYAEDGKMEPCPATGFDWGPFTELFQVSREHGVHISPYQLLKDTDPEGTHINIRS